MSAKGFPCVDCGKVYASNKTLQNHKCKTLKQEEPSQIKEESPAIPSEPASLEEKLRLLQLEVKEKDRLYEEMKEEKERSYLEMKHVLMLHISFLKDKLKEITEKFCEHAVEHVKRPHHTVNIVSNNYMPEEFHLKENMAYIPSDIDAERVIKDILPTISERYKQFIDSCASKGTHKEDNYDSEDEHNYEFKSSSMVAGDKVDSTINFKKNGTGTSTTMKRNTMLPPPSRKDLDME